MGLSRITLPLLSILSLSGLSHAWAMSEPDVETKYDALMAAWEPTRAEFNWFESSVRERGKPVQIAYAIYTHEDEKAAVVISPGRTEPYLKYAEVARDLYLEGYSVYLLDHRGQGLSSRMTRNPFVGYVGSFQDYVDDFDQFMRKKVRPSLHRRVFLLAHSMGGAIAALWEMKHPGVFHASAFVSPMWKVNTQAFPEWAASLVTGVKCGVLSSLFGRETQGEHYVPDPKQKDYDFNARFEDNELTHSRARFERTRKIIADFPRTALGGVSYCWLQQAIQATHEILANASKLKDPFFLLSAGEDRIVKVEGHAAVIAKAPGYSPDRASFFPHAFHEILEEKDWIPFSRPDGTQELTPGREWAMRQILEYFGEASL